MMTKFNKNFIQIFPLCIFVEYLCAFWDTQKKKVAHTFPELLLYIDEPKVCPSTTELPSGLVSEDGIHPSSLGYQYWAIHMAKEIISRKFESTRN